MAMREYRFADGSLVILSDIVRARPNRPGWGYYNVAMFRGINADGTSRDLSVASMPMGKFNQSAKPTGRAWFSDAGCYRLVKTEVA